MPATAAEVLQEFELESATTRRLLERVPADQLNWKPHQKSRSIGQLALHVATGPGLIGQWALQPTLRVSPIVERAGAGDLWPECRRKPHGRRTGLMLLPDGCQECYLAMREQAGNP
jgi:hypothetical protein